MIYFFLNFICFQLIIFLQKFLFLPPNFFKNLIKSNISGSIAQLDKIVFPLAPYAASNAFSVAPTEIEGKFNFCSY